MGCTFIFATPFLLTTHCSGLPPPWHMQSFSKNRWGERGKPNTQRFMLTSSGIQYMWLCKAQIFLNIMCCPNIFFWNNLLWIFTTQLMIISTCPFKSISVLPHSSSECYIMGQFQKASSHGQSAIWAMPSVDSKGTEASCISEMTRNGWYFWEGSCRGWRHVTMCSDLSPFKKDGHSNDTGLLWWSGETPPPPPPTFSAHYISQPLSSQY